MTKFGVLYFSINFMFSSTAFSNPLSQISVGAWGYEDWGVKKYNQELCLDGFSPTTIESRSIRSLQPSKELPDSSYRFTLVKEVYSSVAESERRLDHLKNPPHISSLVSKSCNLRNSFKVNKAVFFVHTDVGVFVEEMKTVVKYYERDITH